MPRRTPAPPPARATFWSRVRVNLSPNRQREILALILAGLGALTLLSLFGYAGPVGAAWANVLTRLVGWGAYALAVAFILVALSLLRREENVFDEFPISWARIVGLEILFAVSIALVHLWFAADDRAALQLAENGAGGGYLGLAVESLMLRAVGPVLAAVILAAIDVLTLRLVFDLSPIGSAIMRGLESLRPARAASSPQQRGGAVAPVPSNGGRMSSIGATHGTAIQLPLDDIATETIEPTPKSAQLTPPRPIFGIKFSPAKKPPAPPPPKFDPLLAVPRTKMRLRSGHLPKLDIFEASAEAKYAQSTSEQKAHVIEETLEQFGIPAKVIDVNAGPTITQFAIDPGFVERRGLDGQIRKRKVPVNRIVALSNDLALALAASPIRIEAPVPGRNYVGIEVPNETIALVSLRGVMESEAYKKLTAKVSLPFALGRDVSGAAAVADLASMPHLLIAGATGSGKSVAINAIIACLLCSHSPDQLRMVMVDPKRVELINFNGIPHLVGPVITDVAQVVPALRWAVKLMDARLQAFSKAGARNIDAYNAKMDKTGGDRMSYLVIIIDELADLMLAAPDDTEKLITRLAQLARATGIHLILATQRPSVDVVTGLIKANFPARISFAVTSSVDSRVVLDTPGAEKLLGRGDMLFMAPDSSKLVRLQGCFVSDDELARLTKHWRDLQEEFDYAAAATGRETPPAPWDEHGGEAGGNGAARGDELLDAAIELIGKSNTASISMLQRKLGIGYPRAARLMDQLEDRGVVGPEEGGGKPRAVMLQEVTKKKK